VGQSGWDYRFVSCSRYQRVFENRSLPYGQIYLVTHKEMKAGRAYDFEQFSPTKLTNDGRQGRYR
jgi:hypothetical protein